MSLCTDLDGLPAIVFEKYPKGILHERPSQSATADELSSEYPTDAGVVGIGSPPVEYACVSSDAAVDLPDYVEGSFIPSVRILVVARLLDDKHFLAYDHDVVQHLDRKLRKPIVRPLYFHAGEATLLSSHSPRTCAPAEYFCLPFPSLKLNPLRYYLIAGEASGDLHGAKLVEALIERDPRAEIRAWGGDLMQAAGATVVKHYRELAFMGFVEVVMNLRTILGNLKACQRDIEAFRPHRLVLIDYPGFNLRIAKWAHPRGLDVSYYISPQIWAWHTSRVHQVRANVDRMLVILPFERDFYAEYGVEATFVGHPLLDVVDEVKGSADQPHIALLPGSRKQEIERSLPIMLAAAARLPDHKYVVAAAPGQPEEFYASMLGRGECPPDLEIVSGQTYAVLATSHTAVVTSGTATLETALFGVPQVVCYRGSALNYWLARRLVASRIKYISLVNLVMDAPVVPELIQHDFNVDSLTAELKKTIAGPERDRQSKDLAKLRVALGEGGAAVRAAEAIVEPKSRES